MEELYDMEQESHENEQRCGFKSQACKPAKSEDQVFNVDRNIHLNMVRIRGTPSVEQLQTDSRVQIIFLALHSASEVPWRPGPSSYKDN